MKKIYKLTMAALLPVAVVAGIVLSFRKEKAAGHLGAPMSAEAGYHSSARLDWEWMRLADPATGKIPSHIREKELAFAATLPNDGAFAARGATPLNWAIRGPWNLGGRTRALGIDVNNENILLAGSASGGMWRSDDGGTSWIPTTSWNIQQSVTCLAQDTRPGKTNTWYYGSGEASGASASGGGAYYLGNGIYKSTDNGLSWTSLTATATNTPQSFESFWDAIWNVATNPADSVNDVVYAATLGTIYRSANGGTTWTAVKGGNLSNYSYYTDVQVTSKGVVYATLSSDGPNKGIWRSEDGVSFTNITPVNFPDTFDRVVIGISPADEDQVWFLANTPGSGLGIANWQGEVEYNSLYKYNYVSGDGSGSGGVWSDRSLNLPSTGGMFDKFNCQGSYDLVVKVSPADTNHVFIGGTNLYRSTNGFADGSQTTFIGGYEKGSALPRIVSYANHHPDQHCILFYPSDPTKMLSANDGGVFRTNNSLAPEVAWTPLNNGYLTSMFYTVAVDHASPGNNIVIGGAQDNGSWWTNSASVPAPWVTPRGGDGSFCAIADNQSAYYFSIQNGKMMKAKLDAAGSVTDFARIDPIGAKGYLFINPFILDPADNNVMYLAAGKQVWRNLDLEGIPYASNWDSISTNWAPLFDSVALPATKVTALAATKSNPTHRLYYGTDKKRVYRVENANGRTPVRTEITSTTFPVAGYVSSIAVDPNNGDEVIVTFSNYGVYSIFHSTDAGTTWNKVAGNLEQNTNGSGNGPSVRWASILPTRNGNVYLVATSTGIYGTSWFSGTNTVWTQLGTNTIGSAVCDMIDVRDSDGLVVVATHSHGIYSTNITSIDQVGIRDIKRADLLSLGNYPNPFTSSTTINFKLAERARVSIDIIDEVGRTARSLVNSELPAGEHSVEMEKGSLAAGTYYCRLTAGNAVETKKMVIVR